MRKVCCFFSEGSGLCEHVMPHNRPTERARNFACGKPVPVWWEPKPRHKVDPENLSSVTCGKCARYVRQLIARSKARQLAREDAMAAIREEESEATDLAEQNGEW